MAIYANDIPNHIRAVAKVGIQAAQNRYPENLKKFVMPAGGTSWRPVSGFWELIATPVSSDTLSEIHTLMGRIPAVSEDLADPAPGGAAPEYAYTVLNKNWFTSVDIDMYALDDDRTGQLAKLFETAYDQCLYHRDLHMFTILTTAAASTPSGYDGSTVFADAHAVGATTADNNNALALTEANFVTTINQMTAFPDSQNQQSAMSVPDTMFVCNTLRGTAIQILNSQTRVADGTLWAAATAPVLNPISAYGITLVIVPQLSGTTAWTLVDMSKAFGPLIMQDRMKATLKLTSPSGDFAIEHNRIKGVLRARYVAAAGYWQRACRGNV